MNAPWEKYANSFCHQEENRGQESSRYRRGLKGGGATCHARGGIGWREVCVYMCVYIGWVGRVCVCVYGGGVQEPARAGIMN